MSIRKCCLLITLLVAIVTLAGCGGGGADIRQNTQRTPYGALEVNAAQVTVEPNVSQIPINQNTRFTIKLTSKAGLNQPLQKSLIGGPYSYPEETRGKSLQDA